MSNVGAGDAPEIPTAQSRIRQISQSLPLHGVEVDEVELGGGGGRGEGRPRPVGRHPDPGEVLRVVSEPAQLRVLRHAGHVVRPDGACEARTGV